MTASITRSLPRADLRRWWLALWLLLASLHAQAQGIHIRSAELELRQDEYHLAATFDVQLTPILEEALNKGVALFFSVDFELIQPRWWTLYLWNRQVAGFVQEHRLSYNALTRQYRLSYGGLHQSFDTLDEALSVLGRVRRPRVFGVDDLAPDRVYEAQIRMRLDTTQLPKPFQIDALASRDWTLASGWYRWTVTR